MKTVAVVLLLVVAVVVIIVKAIKLYLKKALFSYRLCYLKGLISNFPSLQKESQFFFLN
jgi:hypothetical protein